VEEKISICVLLFPLLNVKSTKNILMASSTEIFAKGALQRIRIFYNTFMFHFKLFMLGVFRFAGLLNQWCSSQIDISKKKSLFHNDYFASIQSNRSLF